MATSLSRTLYLACLALWLYSPASRADESDVIVTTCHFANSEWGTEMIDRCVKHNQAVRAEVLQQYAQHERLLNRCREKDELGWDWVKTCIERDLSADSALAAYPPEHAERIASCRTQFAGLGAARVKACVDQP